MNKETLIKLIKSALTFIVVIVLLNYIYTYSFLESDLQEHSEIINLVRQIPADADIVYVGESSNITFRNDDIDKRSISQMIAEYFPTLNVYDITKPAAHAGIYKTLLDNIPKTSNIKTVIVTLNLRSFNANWIFSNLETPLQKSIVLLKKYPPLYNRFLLSFKAYDIKTDKERTIQVRQSWVNDTFNLPFDFPYRNVIQWDTCMGKHGIRDSQNHIDYPQTELACHYIKGFAFQIDTNSNPRIKDFDQIVELAKKRGWNLIFNLLAENTEKANELVGDKLIYFFNENKNILINYYQPKGVTIVNNLNWVEDEQFVDQNWTTEHYAEKGRQIIARNVSEKIKQFHPKNYVAVKQKLNYQTNFFNNCDEENNWGQMQTISSEKSFSNPNSSKTGNGNDYSITLEYPLKKIPDSIKNNIRISFKAYQKSINNEAKLIIQAEGDNFNSFWHGTQLVTQITKTNRWVTYNQTFIIPDSIKQANNIKIYVYNPSDDIVFIDDFSVKFKGKD